MSCTWESGAEPAAEKSSLVRLLVFQRSARHVDQMRKTSKKLISLNQSEIKAAAVRSPSDDIAHIPEEPDGRRQLDLNLLYSIKVERS